MCTDHVCNRQSDVACQRLLREKERFIYFFLIFFDFVILNHRAVDILFWKSAQAGDLPNGLLPLHSFRFQHGNVCRRPNVLPGSPLTGLRFIWRSPGHNQGKLTPWCN